MQLPVGKHFGKHTCFRRRKTIYKSKFNFFFGCFFTHTAVISQISVLRRYKTFAGLLTYSNGAITCLPLFSGAMIGDLLHTLTYLHTPKLFSYSYLTTGCTLPLAYLSFTMCFYNPRRATHITSFFCKAAGTFCIFIRSNLDKGLCIIKLPSSKLYCMNETTMVMLGRNANPLIRGVWLGKAGFNIRQGFRPAVRGVAKNPVDHPHGGRTKSNSPERTPWGKIAKYNK